MIVTLEGTAMSAPSAKSDSTTPAAAGLDRAVGVAVEIGQALRRDFPHLSSRRDGLAIQRGFMRGWSPPVRPGRKPSDRVSQCGEGREARIERREAVQEIHSRL